MNKYLIYFKTSLILQTRMYLPLFFGMVFPIIMTVVFVSGISNSYDLGDFNYINKYFFIATVLSLVANTCLTMPLSFANDLKAGYLKQLKVLGVDVISFKIIDVLVNILVMYLEFIILLLFCYFVYHLDIPSISTVVQYMVLLFPAMFSISVFGISLALLVNKPQNYLAIGITLLMIILTLSGCYGFDPAELESAFMSIYKFIPTYYLVTEGYELWHNNIFDYQNYFIACGVLIAVAILIFIINKLIRRKTI